MKALSITYSLVFMLSGFSAVQSTFFSVCYFELAWRRLLGFYYVPQCESIISYKLEQTDGDLKWCVNSRGKRIPYTTYTIESFPFDCQNIQDCPYGTVFENTGRCEGTCVKAGIEVFYCHNNCICPRGMFRNKEKKCIELADCKSELQTCPSPKVYVKCATRCPTTCETQVVNECKDGCNENLHCVCPDNLVQMSTTNKTCLPPSDCPKCENGAVYAEYTKVCPEVCPSLEEPCTDSGITRQKHCVCPPGKIQLNRKSVICIPAEDCPPICPLPKIINEKSCPKCQATCDNRNPSCEKNCSVERACECPIGYVWLDKVGDDCVKESECPKTEKCEKPQIFTDCATSCPATCLDPEPEFCQRDCRHGVTCVCPDNMVQPDPDTFTCIMPSECPELCEAPKLYESCPASCQPTCDEPNPEQSLCVGCAEDKCVCPKGMVFLSESDHECVYPSDCPFKCEKPKVFADCASYCPPTCDEPSPEICSRACNPRVLCVCPAGMVQRSITNTTCIKLHECPLCPSPKVYRDCASKCQPTCETPSPVFCTEECAKDLHCICPLGFVHPDDRNDSCIPLSSCPVNCPYPLRTTNCASKCPATCDDPIPTCEEKECQEEVKCTCPKGLLQISSKNSTCVLPTQCPNLRKDCSIHKIPTRCASGCPATCQNQRPRFCTKKCRPEVNCECEDGMVQKSLDDDTCVYPRECQ